MLPMPETSVWSRRRRLISVSLPRIRRAADRASKAGSHGSAAMCAAGAGRSVPLPSRASARGTTAHPPQAQVRQVRAVVAVLVGASVVKVAYGRRRRVVDEHLPAHAEVHEEAVSPGGLVTVECQPQVLPPPSRSADHPSGEQRDDLLGPTRLTARRPGPGHLDVDEPTSDHMRLQAPAYDLDLG